MKNPYAGSASAAAAGKAVYAKNCAQCHGNNRQGMGPAPALDSPQVRTANPGELFWFITTGKPSSGMPAWPKLTKQQRWQIVTFLQSTEKCRRTAVLLARAPHSEKSLVALRSGCEIRYNRNVSATNPFFAPKTALITGASSGIGLELAHLFARDGYRLVLVARNRGALRELATELQSRYNAEVWISPKDLAHPASPLELYQELQESSVVLDVLVNNAGFGGRGRISADRLEHRSGDAAGQHRRSDAPDQAVPAADSRARRQAAERGQHCRVSARAIHVGVLRQQGFRTAFHGGAC